MADLGQGIFVNDGLDTCTRENLADIKDKAINIDLIANTSYDVDGTNMIFYAPLNLTPTTGDKTTFDACTHNITCANQEDFQVPLDQWQNDYFAFAKCATNMLTSGRITQALESYVKGWLNNEVAYFMAQQTALYTEFVPSAEAMNIIDITEEMISALEGNGYMREDIIVTYNHVGASNYRKLYQGCCELAGQRVEAGANQFGVQAVINVGNKQAEEVKVYVKDYALFGTYCRSLPEIWDGADEYRGRSLIGGEEGFGTGFYDLTDAHLKYTPPVLP